MSDTPSHPIPVTDEICTFVAETSLRNLPADVQAGLADAAKAQLKKSRVNYANRDKAGAVSWRIECTVER